MLYKVLWFSIYLFSLLDHHLSFFYLSIYPNKINQVSKNEMCPHCGKIIRQDGMKRHILTHISDISCKLCHMKFLTNEELDEHMRKHEENPNYRLLKKKVILYLTQYMKVYKV